MKTLKKLCFCTLVLSLFTSCASFKAQRVDDETSDKRALEITDNWVLRDTEKVIDDIILAMEDHRGFRRFLMEHGRAPTVFVGEVQNMTSEAYFPISEVNDELLTRLSASGDFILVDAAARDRILREITYQNDGMVDPDTAKRIGRQTGADLMIFGNVHMRPETRSGRTIKQYSVNIRMTDIERGVEVMRARTSLSKYSQQSKRGW
jgi:penicillin-binding protein activator